MAKKIAIVGAGLSGLAAAWALRETGDEVVLFEKSRGLSGRAASRTRNGVRFDYGANYFKLDSPELANLVKQQLPTDELVQIEKDVWTFDSEGVISPGDPKLNAEPKWTYRSGISTLGKLLMDTSSATIENSVSIDRIERKDSKWQLFTDEDQLPGEFDSVLMTIPAPQAIAMLNRSDLPKSLNPYLIDSLSKAKYHRQFTVILALNQPIERPGDFFALINTDRKHAIAWLSFENDKPGRVTDSNTVIVTQLSPQWSADHFDVPPQEWIGEVAENVSSLLKTSIALSWWDTQRWMFAHPFTKVDVNSLAAAEAEGLFFCGDGLAGKGRVHLAIETGLHAAARMNLDG